MNFNVGFESGDLAKSENAEGPRSGRALPRLRALSLDRRRELDIRPASQTMGGGRVALTLPTHCCRDTSPILSTGAGLSWPSDIDWQRRIGRDLNVRTVVVAVISIPIESVFAHPKDHLQRA